MYISLFSCFQFLSHVGCTIKKFKMFYTLLSACPSYVSLEVSHDGITVTPMSAPLMTCSLGFIRLQLIRPEVVTMVTIRLHRARDSMTIGLSQILLMGHSAFSETNQKTTSVLAPSDDIVSKTR